jgi:hypothetical protein
MSILTKGLGHKKHMLHFISTFDENDLFTKCQVEDLIKMDKRPSKSPWFNQIDHYDLTFTQMNHTHLMTSLIY